MKKLLHIVATPRQDKSRTLKVSKVVLEEFKNKFPDNEINELNLFEEDLPDLTAKRVDGKYVLLIGEELSQDLEKSWEGVVNYIKHFLSHDIYLLSTPMWNFSIPYVLKHYIDIIIQPKYLFKYTEDGVEGLVKDKKMIVITSRGGDYSTQQQQNFDFQEPYIKAIFGFVGITDITFINAQPMDASGEEVREQRISQAQEEVKELVRSF